MPSDSISSALRLLEAPHMMEILLYVRGRGSCPKKDIYLDVSHNSTMPRKIDALEEAGLISQTSNGHGKTVELTRKGAFVADAIENLSSTLSRVGRS